MGWKRGLKAVEIVAELQSEFKMKFNGRAVCRRCQRIVGQLTRRWLIRGGNDKSADTGDEIRVIHCYSRASPRFQLRLDIVNGEYAGWMGPAKWTALILADAQPVLPSNQPRCIPMPEIRRDFGNRRLARLDSTLRHNAGRFLAAPFNEGRLKCSPSNSDESDSSSANRQRKRRKGTWRSHVFGGRWLRRNFRRAVWFIVTVRIRGNKASFGKRSQIAWSECLRNGRLADNGTGIPRELTIIFLLSLLLWQTDRTMIFKLRVILSLRRLGEFFLVLSVSHFYW